MCVFSGFCAAVGGLRGVFARRVGVLAVMAIATVAAAMPSAGQTITVVNTQDAGEGSLRAAIEEIGRAHVLTPVTATSRMPSSA